MIPTRDNACPACGKGVDDTSGTDPTRALLTLREGEALPNLCFDCGDATKRTVAIRTRRTDEPDSEGGGVFLLIGLVSFVGGLLALLSRRRPGTRIALRLPQCATCASYRGVPEPQHVAWSSHEMTFEVSKTFRRAVRKLRSSSEGG